MKTFVFEFVKISEVHIISATWDVRYNAMTLHDGIAYGVFADAWELKYATLCNVCTRVPQIQRGVVLHKESDFP